MGVPLVYRKGTDTPTVSYNFTDISDGTGVVLLYGYSHDISGAYAHMLDKNPLEAAAAEQVPDGNASNYYGSSLITSTPATFSLNAFQTPRNIRGNCYVNFTWCASGTGTAHVKVDLLKNSTVIATKSTSEYPFNADNKVHTNILAINVPTTNFGKGDVFGVKFTFVFTGSPDGHLSHDPQNRDFTYTGPNVTATTNTTRLRIYVPFNIDN